MKNTAIYMRVSTETQAQEGDSLAAQRDALIRYVNEHQDMVLAGEYIDDGISGTRADRDELQRLLDDVKARKIDHICFVKLDRWFRSVRHYTSTQELLDRYGVTWNAIWESMYDTSTPQGRLIVNQMMSIAQFEAENTGQRIRNVFAYKVTQGEVISGKVPPGFKIVDKHMVANEYAPVVKQAFDYFAVCGNLSQTQGEFQHYHIFPNGKRAFKSLLQNTKYTGRFRDNPNFCERIVDDETFERVQRQLGRNIKISQKRTYLFSGLIRCTECGNRMTAMHKKEHRGKQVGVKGYRCSGYYASRARTCINKKCVNEKTLEKYLVQNIKTMLGDYVLKAEQEQKPARDSAEKIAHLEKKIGRLKELFVNDLITLDEYKKDRGQIDEEIAALKASDTAKIRDLSGYNKIIEGDIETHYKGLSEAQKRAFWRSIIDVIWCDTERNLTVVFI